MSETPKKLGFSVPAEWEAHKAVWLAWPHDNITFENRVEIVEQKFVEIIKALEGSEGVKLLVLNEEMKARAEGLLKSGGVDMTQVTFFITTYADVWLRDYGPMYIKNTATGEQAWVKWEYTAYNKFPTLLKDNEVFLNLEKEVSSQMFRPNVVMEGGSIEMNGRGTLITTEQCLLNSNRNPNLSREQIEEALKENLGIEKIIWLKDGLLNDHTDGHIDDMYRFVGSDTILCSYEEDENDENFKTLAENYEILTAHRVEPLKLIKLPMPHMNYGDGTKAPASYANFYVSNKVVLVPTFEDTNDKKALEIIQTCFPDRKIIGIDSRDLVYGGGGLHCITCQEPA